MNTFLEKIPFSRPLGRFIPQAAVILTALVFLTGASVWEGAAAVSADFPDSGLYAATNAFPRNTVVDATNLETGKTVRVIVAAGLDTPGLLALFSREAAEAMGLRSRTIGRIRMTAPFDPISGSRFNGSLRSGDPDYDPLAAVENAYGPGAASVSSIPEAASSSAASPDAAASESAGLKAGSSVSEAPEAASSSAASPGAATSEPAGLKAAGSSAPEAPEAASSSAASPGAAVSEPAGIKATGSSAPEAPVVITIPVPENVKKPTPEEAAAAAMAEETRVSRRDPESAWTDIPMAALNPSEPPTVEDSPVVSYLPPPVSDLPPSVSNLPPASSSGLFSTPEETPASSVSEIGSGGTTSGGAYNYTLIPAEERPPAGYTPSGGGYTVPQIFSVPAVAELERGKYYLQIGAYSYKPTVEQELAKIDRGYPLTVQCAGTFEKPVYRILVGPVNQGESGALIRTFKNRGYKDAFIRRGE